MAARGRGRADALPAVPVEGPATIHLGSDTVYLVPAPAAHTSGDVVVRSAPADVIQTGDIDEVGAYPFIDVRAGRSVAGTMDATRRLRATSLPG